MGIVFVCVFTNSLLASGKNWNGLLRTIRTLKLKLQNGAAQGVVSFGIIWYYIENLLHLYNHV